MRCAVCIMREQASGGNRADTNEAEETGTGTGSGLNTKTETKTRERDTRTGSNMTRGDLTCNVEHRSCLETETLKLDDKPNTRKGKYYTKQKCNNKNQSQEHKLHFRVLNKPESKCPNT